MKKVLLLLVILIPSFSNAQLPRALASMIKRQYVDHPVITPPTPRDYYVSATGSGDGTVSGTPMSTASFLSAALNAGDHIYFNRGDTFTIPERNIPVNSITIQPYGSGADPIVDGATSLTAATWTSESGGRWSTPLAALPEAVYINGIAAHQAESAWIPISTVNSAQVRTFTSGIDGLSSLIGASLVMKEYNFRLTQELIVTAQSSRQITYSGGVVGADPGMPGKFYNQLQFMSTEGDWAYTGGKLYIQSTVTPAGTNIAISNSDFAFFINNSAGSSIDNIDFRHYTKYSVYGYSSPNLTITNCEFQYSRGDAVRMAGEGNNYFTFTSNTVYKHALRGLEVSAVNYGLINLNTFSEIGTDANLGRPYDDNKTGGTAIMMLIVNPSGGVFVQNNTTVQDNIIHDVGYQGDFSWGNNNIFERNHIYNYMLKWSDGGAFHSAYGNYLGLNSSTVGNIYRNNIIHDGVGSFEGITGIHAVSEVAGIYFDNGQTGNTITDNVIYNPGKWGILLNLWTTNHTVTNNKITGANLTEIEFREDSRGLVPYFDIFVMTNCIVTGNQFVSGLSGGLPIRLYNVNNNASFNPFITLNSNHYVSPYSTTISGISQNGTTYAAKTFATWKTYTGFDASSTSYSNYKSFAAGDVGVFTNLTGSNTNVNIPAGYTDVFGNTPSNPYTLTPFTGLLYLKQ